MTSGNFSFVAVSSIVVDRENRQRRELENIDELAESIKRNGLINPIVVTRDLQLVAGERRLTAHQRLGFDQIAVQYVDDLSDEELQIIELEENIRRVDLNWKDRVQAVAKFDKLKREEQPDWTADDTADHLNMSRPNVSKYMLVNEFLEKGTPEVVEAPKLSTAAGFAQRAKERQKTTSMRELFSEPKPAEPTPASSDLTITEEEVKEKVRNRYAEILNVNFKSWSKEVRETPYNLIHCDFPYGVNAGDKVRGQVGREAWGGYEDKPDVYWELLETFVARQDNFVAPSAHLIFWFSMDFYEETKKILDAAGWVINPFPLIWHKGNTGVLPDAHRGPRRVYETALFATRGDRKIVRAVGNCVAAEVNKEFHMSEKPKPMLEHFMRMLVDETSVVLDPTCGSGNAIAVAERLGANWATGLELNEEFADRARLNLGLDT
jgi:ParB/RepB/Spo0J family partition protein